MISNNQERRSLPSHGPITCRDCWKNYGLAVKEQVTKDGEFRLVNDPGAWGSSNPQILVLGISKGNTQAKVFAKGEFDDVAFANCRPRLRASLAAVGLVNPHDYIDRRMTAIEQDLAFGSVVRCSMTGDKKGKWSAGTPEAIPAFSHPVAKVWLENCFRRYLGNLPTRLRIIALAGNDGRWVKTVSESVQRLYPDTFSRINQVAYHAAGKLWVHIGHPSPGNGHFNSFISGSEDQAQGRKRLLAKEAIVNHTGKLPDGN